MYLLIGPQQKISRFRTRVGNIGFFEKKMVLGRVWPTFLQVLLIERQQYEA